MRQRQLAAAGHGWHDDDELHHGLTGDGLDMRQRQLAAAVDLGQHLHDRQARDQLDLRQRELAAAVVDQRATNCTEGPRVERGPFCLSNLP